MAHVEVKAAAIVPPNEIRVLLPKKALAELYSLLSANDSETIEFAQDQSTLFFRIGSRILSCRQVNGTFPKYETVLPRDFPHSLEVSNLEFFRAIQRVSQFADFQSSAVRLNIEKDLLRLSSSSPEAGESEETLEITHTSEPESSAEDKPADNLLRIGFNSRYLLDFARAANAEKLTFYFRGAEAAAELRPVESGQDAAAYRYVIMPMRA